MNPREDFWARRKAGVLAEQDAEIALDVAEQDAVALAENEAKDDAEILAELDLPDPDTLEMGDDVAGFMSKAVPDRLRRRALRRFWRLNPILANVDGLVDYGEDFTDAACVIENMQTAYQVGKGMLYHVQEMERQEAAAAEAEANPEPEVEDPETEADDQEAGADNEPTVDAEGSEHSAPLPLNEAKGDDTVSWYPTDDTVVEPETFDAAPAPRRMRFEFQG